MKVTYENSWEYTDIHIDVDIPYREGYQMRMLRENRIPGLLPVKGAGRDGQSRYTYRINGGQSMEELFGTREMKKRDVERFIEDLLNTVGAVTGHLLEPDGLILSPDMVYLTDGHYRFCYLPASGTEEKLSLCRSFHQMTEYFVKKLDYHDTSGIILVYRLHKDTMQDSFELRKIIEACRKEEEELKAEKEKRKRTRGTGAVPDGALFSLDDREDGNDREGREKKEGTDRKASGLEDTGKYRYTQASQSSMVKEEPVRYGKIKKAVRKLKGGRWGEWQDLITETDGHGRKGIL